MFGTCVPNVCPLPTGNCCDQLTGNCSVVTEAACTAAGFTWLGAGPCNAETCREPVPTERTSWGHIKNIYR